MGVSRRHLPRVREGFSVEVNNTLGDRFGTSYHSIPRSVTCTVPMTARLPSEKGCQSRGSGAAGSSGRGWGQRNLSVRPAWAYNESLSWRVYVLLTLKEKGSSFMPQRMTVHGQVYRLASKGLFFWSALCIVHLPLLSGTDGLQCSVDPDANGVDMGWGPDRLSLRHPARGWILEIHKLLTPLESIESPKLHELQRMERRKRTYVKYLPMRQINIFRYPSFCL